MKKKNRAFTVVFVLAFIALVPPVVISTEIIKRLR